MTTIALVGKGGAGKTTIAGLLAKVLVDQGKHPLVVDADPTASHLANSLGITPRVRLEDVRKDVIQTASKGDEGKSRELALSLDDRVMDAIMETPRFDLLVIGQPEGAGCFCPANNLLRAVLETILDAYRFIIIDCEAGLEQISRKVIRNVDYLLIVVEPTRKGIDTAKVIKETAKKFTSYEQIGLIMNKTRNEDNPVLKRRLEEINCPVLGNVPEDPEIVKQENLVESILDISLGSLAFQAVASIAATILK